MDSSHDIDAGRWKTAKAIFRTAIELEEDDRPDLVERECGDDLPLRDLVEELLDSDRRASDPLCDPLPELFDSNGSDQDPSSPRAESIRHSNDGEPTVGQVISHYVIRERIDEGGMGVVFRAQDIHLDRDVALKFLPPHLCRDPAAARRMIVEAQTAAMLDDSRICTIFEIGGVESGRLFISMAFCVGETLEERLRRGPLPTAEALRIATEIAGGLEVAHAQGIVHRDIKPANIMLAGDGRVKILDFGIARFGTSDRHPNSESTAGTRAYMSPEQIRGESLDGRSDLWSLGTILYRMLAGRLPFSGRSHEEITRAVLEDKPEPIGTPRNRTPRNIQSILRKTLAKRAVDRYPDAAGLERALLRAKEDSEADPGPSIRQRARRGALTWGGAAIVLAAVSAATLLSAFFEPAVGLEPVPIRSVAVLPFENLSRDSSEAYFPDGLAEALIADLGRVESLRVISRTSAWAFRDSDLSLAEIADALGVDAVIKGTVIRENHRIRITADLIRADPEELIWTHSYERNPQDVLGIISDLAREVADQVEATLTMGFENWLAVDREVNPEALDLYLRGRYQWHQTNMKATLAAKELFERAIAIDPGYAPPYAGLADVYTVLHGLDGKPRDEVFPRAREYALKAIDLDPFLADPHTSLMRISLAYDWDWAQAQLHILRAFELNPNYPLAHQWYAAFLASQGRHEEAWTSFQRAQELDPDSPRLALLRLSFLYMARRFDDAIAEARPLLAINPDLLEAQTYLGRSLLEKGLHSEAIEVFEALAPSQPTSYLAHAYAVTGRTDEAEALLLELERYPGGEYAAAVVNVGLGRHDRALDWLEKAYRERMTVLVSLGIDPRLDPIRGESRFRELKALVLGE